MVRSKMPDRVTVKLSKQAPTDVAHLKTKNIAVVGVISRQESPETRGNDSGQMYNPYDHLSLAITTALQRVSFPGMARYNRGD